MRIAYLILAHDRPRHLTRLIRALDDPSVEFFVHIDAKSDITPFRPLASAHSNLTLLEEPDRIPVFWCGFSTVTAILNLIAVARKSATPFSRFVLLSGVDYPIKPRSRIHEALATDTEFIRVDFKVYPDGDERFVPRVKYLHLFDHPRFNPRITPPTPLTSAVLRVLKAFPRRSFPPIPLYQGSAWWALTAPCVDYILQFLRDHPGYARFFRQTAVPDESFFHSIVLASPFRPRVSHDVESGPDPFHDQFDWDDYASHFIDWKTPGIELPKTLGIEDLDRVLNSQALFARKFRSPYSDPLVRKLRKHIRTDAPQPASPSLSGPDRLP